MKNDAFLDCDDVKTLALCIYGEARGEGIEGMLAVGSVVCNRARQTKRTVKFICLKPKQFSCFNSKDTNREVLEGIAVEWDKYIATNKYLKQAYWIARGLIEGYLYSNVGDANHYHAESVSPSWAKSMTRVKQIKNHIFLWDASYDRR